MQLTMSGEYAIRAMIYLATFPQGTTVQIAEISVAWEIPEKFLRKITTQLAKAGIISTQRGQRGGIQFARPSDSLTLLDIIEAVEGKIYLNKCLVAGDFCHRTVWCQVHSVWGEAQNAVKAVLTRKTLKQLADESTEAQDMAMRARIGATGS